MRTRPAVLDFIIIAIVTVLALSLFALPFLRPAGETVTVSVKSGQKTEILHTCKLSESRDFEIKNNGITLKVTVGGGEVHVSHSDCDDRVCVNSGKISRSGQSIICAPAGVVINVVGGGSDEDISAG